jgi:hypothetical protein
MLGTEQAGSFSALPIANIVPRRAPSDINVYVGLPAASVPVESGRRPRAQRQGLEVIHLGRRSRTRSGPDPLQSSWDGEA